MAKVRVMYAEVEGGDEAVRDVISRFVGQIGGSVDRAEAAVVPAAPPAAAIAPPVVTAPPAKAARPREQKAAPRQETPANEAEAKVIALLRAGEKTSREIIEASGLEGSQVYYVLDKLRKQRVVETHEVEGSMYRKNRLVTK